MDLNESSPGPGRYNPDFHYASNRDSSPSYFIGQKNDYTSSLNVKTGTTNIVGPGSYKVSQSSNFSSIKPELPKWSFPNSKRPDLGQKIFTKNETYNTQR